ncbi:MAG TPA: hypothetical protein VGA98_05420 [Allosphingosinicella sp.]
MRKAVVPAEAGTSSGERRRCSSPDETPAFAGVTSAGLPETPAFAGVTSAFAGVTGAGLEEAPAFAGVTVP